MIGRVIEGFQITEKLGEGGMGEVYRATDTSLGRVVALKVLHSDLTKDTQLTDRFLSEARTQAQLNHPNLATLYRLFQFEGSYCMVMEYVDGETFSQMVRREGPILQDRAIPLFKQALAGLAHAHHAGIIHRDIKPSNLMVNRDGIVKVMDFGIAKILGGRGLTATGVRLGTLYYMSPEQIRNQPLDIRTDIYALGITLYELLTGRVPFDSNSDYDLMQQHIQQPPPHPRQFFPYLAQGLEEAIMQALEKDPARRFQTVEALSRALDEGLRATKAASIPAMTMPTAGMAQTVAVTPPPPSGGGTPLPKSATPSSGAAARVATPPGSLPVVPPQMPPPPSVSYPATPQPGYHSPTPVSGTVPYPTSGQPPQVSPKKSSLVPLILAGFVVLVVAVLGIVFIARFALRRRTSPPAVTIVSAPSPEVSTQPASPPSTPPPAKSEPAPTTPAQDQESAVKTKPVELKNEETARLKEPQKGSSRTRSSAKNQIPQPDPSLQALIQQQIEQERLRQLQQQQAQEQKKPNPPTPPAPKPPVETPAAVFRYHVAHSHGGFSFDQKCVGILTISGARISFVPESGPHHFDVPSEAVREFKKNSGFWSVPAFHIKLKNGENYNLARLDSNNKFISPVEIMTQMKELMPSSAKR